MRQTSELREVSTLITKGTTPSSVGKQFTTKGINFVKSESICDSKYLNPSVFTKIDAETDIKLKRSRLKEGDLLFSIAGAYLGKLSIVRKKDLPANTNQAVGIVRIDKSKADVHYLYYFFSQSNVNKYINNLSAQSSQPNLNLDLLGRLIFNYVDIVEQRKIADVLSSIDQKIELNNQINAELEAIAKTLYDYWFVQFDFPDAEGKPYKSSGGKMVYNADLKREIPEGWKVSTLANWVQNDKTGDWGQESEEGNYTLQVYCIRGTDTNDISSKGNIGAPKRFILHKNNHKLLSPFDFVIEISGGSTNQSTGRMATITNEVLERFDHPLICSNFCKAISLVDSDYFYNFEYLWQRLYDNDVLFGWEGKTSGIKNLLFDSFVSNHNLPMPPKELAKKFFDFADRAHKKNQNLLKENKHLEDLRDWLLPMLMNGQVTVNQ